MMTQRQPPLIRKSRSQAEPRVYRALLSLIFFIDVIMILAHLWGRVQIDFTMRRNEEWLGRKRRLQAEIADLSVQIDNMKSYQRIAALAREQGLEPVSAGRLQDLPVDLKHLHRAEPNRPAAVVYAGLMPFRLKSQPSDTAAGPDVR
jgi:hypothetical protein